ncbi:hypothetical protein ACFVGM_08890 [Kitasatospora purpeofusca]|uniref:hypothetical protein n=1 Tax=Kitasatospora purpeofusca TaxID=67352 RepID=UPI0036CAF2BB
MPLLASEDRALKLKLSGLAVHDATAQPSGRPVTVRYRDPEYQVADLVFPLILITHRGIKRAPERESRGMVHTRYAPEGHALWPDPEDLSKSPYWTEMPIPLDVEYQVDAYCRKNLHMIELAGKLMQLDFLPFRFGYLSVPEDRTVRRLDLNAGPEFTETRDESGKRLFQATWSISVSAEIFLADLYTVTPAERVVLHLDQFWPDRETT